jgi:uncharacterized protein YlxW (UPF0749 family)
VLGILVSVQWPASTVRSEDTLDPIQRTIHQLELEQEELKRTVGLLRERLDARQGETGASAETLDGLRNELLQEKMRAGLVDVRGPGIQLVLDDSDRVPTAGDRLPTGSANDYLVHDHDLRDAISLLWSAGAEAIAVNGERIVASSSVYCVGSTVMVNDTRLSPPYRISAIGDPSLLRDTVENPGYLGELKNRRSRYGVRLDILRVESIVVPAYRGSLPLRYAQPGS